MSSLLKYTPTISITGDMSATPSLGTHNYTSQNVANYETMILKNDSLKKELPLGNADYYTFVHLTTDNPISVMVNSSAASVIPCENVMAISGGENDITQVWVKNAGASLATIKVIYSGKLTV